MSFISLSDNRLEFSNRFDGLVLYNMHRLLILSGFGATSASVLSRNIKTIFKLATAFNMSVSMFLSEIEKELPKGFSVSEE